MTRLINLIVVHCSATPPSDRLGAGEIKEWHRERGFDDIGYHDVIRTSGVLEQGRPLDIAGAHARGHNANSIGICLIGGTDAEGNPQANFTRAQLDSLKSLLLRYTKDYPEASIGGHGDLPNSNKACPCFSISHWLVTGEVLPVRGSS